MIDLQMQIQLLIGESQLACTPVLYRVAAWQRDLDTPPWRQEERKSTHTWKEVPFPCELPEFMKC